MKYIHCENENIVTVDLKFMKSRMKYNINKELSKIVKQKAPSNIKLYPFISFVMKYMFKCKSDDAVNVIQYEIAGYMDAKLKTYVIEPRNC